MSKNRLNSINDFSRDIGEAEKACLSSGQLSYRELEPRIAFDAALADTLSDTTESGPTVASSVVEAVDQESNNVAEMLEAFEEAISSTTIANSGRSEIVFIDPSIDDVESIISSIAADAEIILIDAESDGIEQVALHLAKRSDVDAVHIISHGESGALSLGTGILSVETMQGWYADEMSAIAEALGDSADILIYGCNFGEGANGKAAMHRLAALTGADIAASSDLTGHMSKGGDWDLEIQHGVVETESIVSKSSWMGALATATVTNTTDTINGDTSSISNLIASDGGDGISLSEAIEAANNTAGADDIHFSISTADPNYVDPDAIAASGDEYWEIYVGSSGLPLITDAVNLDATTQPGYAGAGGRPVIELDGTATGSGSGINGITIRANDSTVRGFSVHSFVDEGIEIDGSTGFGDNNTVANNWVGVDLERNVSGNAEFQVMVSVDATNNRIGGTGTNDGNVIVGAPSGFSGLILRQNADGNFIEGNYIGLLDDGITAAGNAEHGVLIGFSSDNNIIGGTAAGAGNVVSGNGADGIHIDGTTDATYTTVVTGTQIVGNIIGLDATGTIAVANGDDGIDVKNGATNTTIGGNTTAHRNIISGNTNDGVYLEASGNRVVGNYIGTDIAGGSGVGNGGAGVRLWNAGTANMVGSTTPGAGNLIAYNGSVGVEVDGASTGVLISSNDIHSNAGLGIDLNADGSSSNDVGDADGAANSTQNFPILLTALSTGSQITITGSLNSTASRTFRIEFFENLSADPSGYGEGAIYLGSTTVSTDASGNALINFVLPASVDANSIISATATDLTTSDTSEFSLNVAVNETPTITSDGGGATASVNAAENQTSVTTVTASDPDLPPDTLTYTLVGGADQALFSITAGGVLTFNTAPDFETPGDADLDGVYEVTVQVDDGNGGIDTQAISVTVTDAADGIQITPISVVPLGNEVLVNSTTLDIQLLGANVSQAMAADSSGNYIITWASNLQDGSGYGIFAQRYSFDGVPIGGEFQVNTTTADSQLNPAVGMDQAGNFTIVWQSNLQDGDSYGVYAQRYDSAGVPVGGELLVNTTTVDYQGSPTIAMSPTGEFVVVWTSNGQDPDGSLGIYAQLFDNSGSAVGSEFRVNTYTLSQQQVTSASMDAVGGFVVTWGSNNQDGSNYGVFGQRFDSAGNAVGAEFQVNTTTLNSQLYNDVAMLPDGRFVVAYQSVNGSGNTDLFFQRYAADGSTVGGEIQVNTVSDPNYFPIPSISSDTSGNITVTWNRTGDGDGNGVFARRFDWNGTALSGEFQVNTTTSSDQTYPEVLSLSDGRFIIAWSGNGPGDADGIFFQQYGLATAEDGSTATFQIVLESAPTATVTIPLSVSDPTEGSIAVGSVVFDAGNWNIPQLITVTGLPDFVVDGDQYFDVVLGTASSSDSNFNGLDPDDIKIVNLDVPNTDPVITSDGGGATASVNAAENQTLVTTVTASDPDLPPDTLTYTLVGGADQALFSITAGGVLTFNTAPDFETPGDADLDGVYEVTVQVDDGNGGIDTQAISVTVTDANEAPVAVVDNIVTSEDTIFAGNVLTNDSDPETDPLTVTLINGAAYTPGVPVGLPSGAQVTMQPNGVFVYNPLTAFDYLSGANTAPDSFTYQLSDGNGNFDTGTVNVTVTAANDAPVITSDGGGATASVNAAENQTLVTTVTASDPDLPPDTLTYTLVGGADQALFSITAGGVLTFNTAPDFETPGDADLDGVYEVTVQVDDGNGGIDTQLLLIVVDAEGGGVNDPDGGDGPADVSDPEPLPELDPELETDPPESGEEPVSDNFEVEEVIEPVPPGDVEPKPDEKPAQTDNRKPATAPEETVVALAEISPPSDGVGAGVTDLETTIADAAGTPRIELNLNNLNQTALWEALDRTAADMDKKSELLGLELHEVVVGSGSALTAGFVAWILRGSALASSLLATLPAWQRFDPIVIFITRDTDEMEFDQIEEKLGPKLLASVQALRQTGAVAVPC